MADIESKLSSRYRSEARFKWAGRLAIAFSVLCIAGILVAILSQALSALRLPFYVSTVGPEQLEQQGFLIDKLGGEALKVPDDVLSAYAVAHVQYGSLAGEPAYFYLLSDAMNRYVKSSKQEAIGVSHEQRVWVDRALANGRVKWRINRYVFQHGNSRHPELAGVWASFKGSLLALAIAVLLAFPLGVAAAVYLEEFAPVNRWISLLEININNLAAIPSIVYGLLGLALFINVFQVPRAVPFVGGLVLAMMMLPVVIIASRAALLAVPLEVRYAAIGVGASGQQVVLHHVLPQAAPRILTGLLLAVGNLVGEAAPLLTLGMVAFFADVPESVMDPATALPVQIYMWSMSADETYMEAAATGILLLLLVLVVINMVANGLRRWFERRLDQ